MNNIIPAVIGSLIGFLIMLAFGLPVQAAAIGCLFGIVLGTLLTLIGDNHV